MSNLPPAHLVDREYWETCFAEVHLDQPVEAAFPNREHPVYVDAVLFTWRRRAGMPWPNPSARVAGHPKLGSGRPGRRRCYEAAYDAILASESVPGLDWLAPMADAVRPDHVPTLPEGEPA